jgi:hypothetical protein
MNVIPGGSFAAALVFGALAIWFHAWNQFNRPSYQEASDFNRIVQRLQPSDMRRGPVFIQAYIFYALILTFIYLLICFYASVPFLRNLVPVEIPGLDLLGGTAGAQNLPDQAERAVGFAFDEVDAGLDAVDGAAGPDPSLPLLVSLAVVGLAPNVPFLYRIEEWLRTRSHRLSGIPTHLVESGLKLREEPLFDRGRDTGLLISDEDWERARLYFDAAGRYRVADRDILRDRVMKIIALRNWVLRGRVFIPDGATASRYRQLESDIRQNIRALLARLDALSLHGPGAQGGAPSGESPEETTERNQEWMEAVREADVLCGDISVLVALYSEREAFAAQIRESRSWRGDTDNSYEQQKKAAAVTLVAALKRVEILADQASFGTTVFFRLAGAIVLVAVLTGLFFGESRQRGTGDLAALILAFKYAVSAVITYTLPLFFALSMQQEGLKRGTWEPIVGGKLSRALSQYVIIFIIATLIALVGLIANNIYQAIVVVGFERVSENFPEVLRYAYLIESHRAILGGLLATCIALIIDAWRAERLGDWTRPAPFMLVLLPGLLLGVAAWWERFQSSLIAASGSNSQSQVSFLSLGYLKSALPAALIGLVAAIYVIQSLMDEFGEDAAREER